MFAIALVIMTPADMYVFLAPTSIVTAHLAHLILPTMKETVKSVLQGLSQQINDTVLWEDAPTLTSVQQ